MKQAAATLLTEARGELRPQAESVYYDYLSNYYNHRRLAGETDQRGRPADGAALGVR